MERPVDAIDRIDAIDEIGRDLDVPDRKGEEVFPEGARLRAGAEDDAGAAGAARDGVEDRERGGLVGRRLRAELPGSESRKSGTRTWRRSRPGRW